MGGSSWSEDSYVRYSASMCKSYDASTKRVTGQVYSQEHLAEILNPKDAIRECCISDEHPNPIPVILALDVTGSMGSACQETAEALGAMMDDLYKKFKDIEIMVMGIGDFECDDAPLQAGQFESDIRISQQLDKIYMEHGGGGNSYESYSAAWLFGVDNCRLEPFDKQGRKGIIITMGDEPLNPDLKADQVKAYMGTQRKGLIKTDKLYEEASQKFDIFHIQVQHGSNYRDAVIEESFGQLLGSRFKKSGVNGISTTIVECITEALENAEPAPQKFEEGSDTASNSGEINW